MGQGHMGAQNNTKETKQRVIAIHGTRQMEESYMEERRGKAIVWLN